MSTSVSSVVSHFPSAENGFTTTTSGSVSSGATTVGLNSVAGYTNGEIVVFVIDPSNASKQTFTGVIDTSGVQVTSVVWTAGTNVTHLSGATVVDYATATHISMITKGLLVQHTQAGAHSAVTATSVATTGDISSSAGKITTTAVDKLEDYGVPLSTYRANTMFDHVASGGVWTGDAYASTRNASMTAMVCYINGRRISISAVTARSFTASKDTYIDVLDNADGTGTLVYTEVANNAASPALAANSLRIGIIVTGASNIASVASINQGQEGKVLPIASSIPYMTTDSLGNLICPRDPNRRILGYRQNVSNQTYTTPYATVPGLTCPVIVPTGRKIKITHWARSLSSSAGAGTNSFIAIVESSTVLSEGASTAYTANAAVNPSAEAVLTPSAGLHTYLGQAKTDAGTGSIAGAATYPNFIRVELV